MCRLFGFRSVIPSQVHKSLLDADNALAVQSCQHPDGWGVAYYVDGCPHLTKSASTALHDTLFRRVSGIVASETVIAHVRKATVGASSVLNTHPFQHGRWTFAHNGDIPEFDRCRGALLDAVTPRLRRYVLGETDSEVIFFLLLSALGRHAPLDGRFSAETVIAALTETVGLVRRLADGDGAPAPALLNLLVTNGTTLAAIHGGKDLYWSTYKTRCSDRDTCGAFSPECESPSKTGLVHHLIISSEPLHGENVWLPMRQGEIVGIDWQMRVVTATVAGEQRIAS